MNLAKLMRRSYRRTTARNRRNTQEVTLLFDTTAAPVNENRRDSYPAIPEPPSSVVVRALCHWPDEAEITLKGWQEIEKSDVLIDFDGALSFDGKNNLRFQIDGRLYQPKAPGKLVPEYFDVKVSGQRIIRTVVASLIQ